jgi:hypothetical protein
MRSPLSFRAVVVFVADLAAPVFAQTWITLLP